MATSEKLVQCSKCKGYFPESRTTKQLHATLCPVCNELCEVMFACWVMAKKQVALNYPESVASVVA